MFKMTIKIRCSHCNAQRVIDVLEVREFKRCPICNSLFVLDEDVHGAIKKAMSVSADQHLKDAINHLGLERVVELVNNSEHLKRIYKYRINKLFRGREVIK